MVERRVCIRGISRWKEGWGVTFVGEEVPTYAFYPSLEHCIRAEYAVQVLGKDRPKKNSWWLRGSGV